MMTPEQKAAYVNSQAACAVIEALAMMTENGQKPYEKLHKKQDFEALIEKYGLQDNVVTALFGKHGDS